MKIIKNRFIPFKGFNAITLYPFIFTRLDKLEDRTIRHEEIHAVQQKEWFIIGFYILYLIEYIFKGYRNISFEQEAYDNADNIDYLKNRKRFANYAKNR